MSIKIINENKKELKTMLISEIPDKTTFYAMINAYKQRLLCFKVGDSVICLEKSIIYSHPRAAFPEYEEVDIEIKVKCNDV